MNRNPWKGISPFRELLYDLRHPLLFHKRAWDGVRGRNNISSAERFVGIGCIVVGLALVCLGVTTIVLT